MATANSTPPPLQAASFKEAAKLAMMRRNLTVAALANRLGRQRNTVSIAINHETMCPGVKEEIKKELGFHI
ncbi:hypothetical protein [Prosthecobacter dejongeii]|nr:hypothetical protein [Prosthecobacter dejongeii]